MAAAERELAHNVSQTADVHHEIKGLPALLGVYRFGEEIFKKTPSHFLLLFVVAFLAMSNICYSPFDTEE